MVQNMESKIYIGNVRHRRFSPKKHFFNYPIFMPYINLDEFDEIQSLLKIFGKYFYTPIKFQKKDYLQNSQNIKKSVLHKFNDLEKTNYLDAQVFMLCQFRYCEIFFSPSNIYYIYQKNILQGVLVEVSNTPWNERFYYSKVILEEQKLYKWSHEKSFHVSPFNPMDQIYHWKINNPSKYLKVHMDVCHENKVFDATLILKGFPFSKKLMRKCVLKTPSMTFRILINIYWEALNIWLKGNKFYSHPDIN